MCKYSTKKIANSTPFSASSWFFKVCILFIRGLEKSSQHFLSISVSFDTHNDYIVNTMNEISMTTPNVTECSVNAVLVPENFPKKGK